MDLRACCVLVTSTTFGMQDPQDLLKAAIVSVRQTVGQSGASPVNCGGMSNGRHPEVGSPRPCMPAGS
jgi:hypothetical protein